MQNVVVLVKTLIVDVLVLVADVLKRATEDFVNVTQLEIIHAGDVLIHDD